MSNESFPRWLQTQLDARNLLAADLAKKAGIGKSTVHSILHGKRNVGPEVCTAIAKALNLSADDVFRQAGLLPPEVAAPFERDESVQEIMGYLREMSATERAEAAEYLAFRFVKNRRRAR